MSQDKEREDFEHELRRQCFQKPTPEAYDLAWCMWKARATLSTQPPAVQGEPRCQLSWGGFNLYGDEKSINKAKELLHDAGIVPMLREVILNLDKLLASPPSREPLTELLIEAEFGSDSNESYPDFLAGVRFAERAHGIHSREGGSNV